MFKLMGKKIFTILRSRNLIDYMYWYIIVSILSLENTSTNIPETLFTDAVIDAFGLYESMSKFVKILVRFISYENH